MDAEAAVMPPPAPYRYEPLDSPISIRLLDLLPGAEPDPVHVVLRQVELPEDSDTIAMASEAYYTALSYTWGPPDPQFLIYVQGKSYQARANLLSALSHLRDRQTVQTFWIDALCINQGDVYEKNRQVSLMARIYRTARKTRVWLGSSTDQSLMGIQWLADECDDISNPAYDLRAAPIQSLASLLKQAYWSRVWIIQEFLLARTIELQYGKVVVAGHNLEKVCLAMRHLLPQSQATALVNQRTATLRGDTPLQSQTLESLIRTYSSSECTDRRDRVFALLSLAADCASGTGMKPDYGITRFGLLMQVLEFCRPENPVEFISLLLRALQRHEGDVHWGEALELWTQGTLSQLDPSVWEGFSPEIGFDITRM
ncbi:hypothetical protein PV08_05060 [Exophiala spinifera]|uniref:Heterokaryon incompatibility domain-containing protein n=1 Tax=Exophiala spinifera TaxID=91928 RepID=A0A0D2BGW9_9EURO|nr:uncharacterized protein PV08_05060 [Exophiala spinifera]KIW17865.1 hypothetical protein PV08_05060 [Exophiala spinifera]